MNPKYFLPATLFFLLILSGMYIGLFIYQFGANPIKSESWFDNIKYIKEAKAEIINSPKIIIISGSNSMVGINSKFLSEKLNMPVLNLAMSYNLDIEYLEYQIKKYIKNGDIVVMPLEYIHYSRSDYSDWFVNNMMVWDNSFITKRGVLNFLHFLQKVPPLRVFRGIMAKLKNNTYKRNQELFDAFLKYLQSGKRDKEELFLNGKNAIPYQPFITIDGDVIADSYGNNNPQNFSYVSDLSISEHFINSFHRISEIVREDGYCLSLR